MKAILLRQVRFYTLYVVRNKLNKYQYSFECKFYKIETQVAVSIHNGALDLIILRGKYK